MHTLVRTRARTQTDTYFGNYSSIVISMYVIYIANPVPRQELQELSLQLREQLIVCGAGRERAAAAERGLRAQLLQHGQLLLRREAELAQHAADLRAARYRSHISHHYIHTYIRHVITFVIHLSVVKYILVHRVIISIHLVLYFAIIVFTIFN